MTNPYPVDLTAVFTLTFAGSGTPSVDDPAVQFSTGGRTLTFVVPANSTTVPPIQLQSGTERARSRSRWQLTAGGVTPQIRQAFNRCLSMFRMRFRW